MSQTYEIESYGRTADGNKWAVIAATNNRKEALDIQQRYEYGMNDVNHLDDHWLWANNDGCWPTRIVTY